jgi:hypothetical protein
LRPRIVNSAIRGSGRTPKRIRVIVIGFRILVRAGARVSRCFVSTAAVLSIPRVTVRGQLLNGSGPARSSATHHVVGADSHDDPHIVGILSQLDRVRSRSEFISQDPCLEQLGLSLDKGTRYLGTACTRRFPGNGLIGPIILEAVLDCQVQNGV